MAGRSGDEARAETPGAFRWSEDKSRRLQEVCDSIFKQGDAKVSKLRFSFTIADPFETGCPLVGCSTGFSDLCGYEMEEIVGHNCRFLVDPVPQEMVDAKVRKRARDFCDAVHDGRDYALGPDDIEPWMPQYSDGDSGIFFVQMNARKDGSFFRNMFYLQTVDLHDRTFIIGLQSELPDIDVVAVLRKARQQLDENMNEVERVLSSMFWYQGGMRRQDDRDPDDGFAADDIDDATDDAVKHEKSEGPMGGREGSDIKTSPLLPECTQRQARLNVAPAARVKSCTCCVL